MDYTDRTTCILFGDGAGAVVLGKPRTSGPSHTLLSTRVYADGSGAELKHLEEITSGDLFTLAIDATGSPKSMSNAFRYVGHTGRLVFVGITPQDVSFPDPLLHSREMTVYASRNALPDDFRRIIKLIEEGRIDTRPWITHRTGFDAMIGEFPSFTKPETGVIKAVVEL